MPGSRAGEEKRLGWVELVCGKPPSLPSSVVRLLMWWASVTWTSLRNWAAGLWGPHLTSTHEMWVSSTTLGGHVVHSWHTNWGKAENGSAVVNIPRGHRSLPWAPLAFVNIPRGHWSLPWAPLAFACFLGWNEGFLVFYIWTVPWETRSVKAGTVIPIQWLCPLQSLFWNEAGM